MDRKILPETELLRQLFSYDPSTGILTRSGSGRVLGYVGSRRTRYLLIQINGKKYLLHRVIWKFVTGEEPPPVIDHKDRDRTNNRWINFRAARQHLNLSNRGATAPRLAEGRLKGAYLVKNGRWRAVITCRGEYRHIGQYATETEAHDAYCRAAKEAVGEFFCP